MIECALKVVELVHRLTDRYAVVTSDTAPKLIRLPDDEFRRTIPEYHDEIAGFPEAST
jgi:hypothetical protein